MTQQPKFKTEVPEAIIEYKPVITWILRIFEDHTDIGIEDEVHSKLQRLITLYREGENKEKLSHDIAKSDFWQIRTMALHEEEAPEYWQPMIETFRQFRDRVQKKNKIIRTNPRLGSNPPTDIILTQIAHILKTGQHKLLRINHYDSSYS